MKIQKYERVQYDHNPLAEVICQVRFVHAPSFVVSLPENVTLFMAQLGYTQLSEEQILNVPTALLKKVDGEIEPIETIIAKVFHFSSATEAFKVSISSDFIALTCSKYVNWSDFRHRFIDAYSSVRSAFDKISPIRTGLRYKSLIERESLGLADVAWSKLISPFLLGPLSPNSLSTGSENSEDEIMSFVTQATIQLDDCGLVLQSALLRSTVNDRRAFLIDSDFFIERAATNAPETENELIESLNRLHNNAGSLFRHSITKELHDALGPNSV